MHFPPFLLILSFLAFSSHAFLLFQEVLQPWTQYSFLNSLFGGGNNGSRSLSGDVTTLDTWLETEQQVALERLLANIAPGGRNTDGAVPGTVIASPSREHPDYYYQWTRDSAITLSTLVRIYATSADTKLLARIDTIFSSYIDLQRRLQQTPNPSGTYDDLTALGEPKFLVSGDPFTGSWGRPQRDGPALRALTLTHYLRAYNSSQPSLWNSTEEAGSAEFFRKLYDAKLPTDSVIKADLEYVSHYWQSPGFDLWEEVDGLHFFTAMVQIKALKEGASLALAFGDEGAAAWYDEQHSAMLIFMEQFQDVEKGRIRSTLNSSRSGLDCSVILGSLSAIDNTYPGDDDDDDDSEGTELPFPPWSDAVLLSAYSLITDAAARFPINNQSLKSLSDPASSPFEGVGIGRYPEDVYDGYATASTGNPWFLCTSAVGQFLHLLALHYSPSYSSSSSSPAPQEQSPLDQPQPPPTNSKPPSSPSLTITPHTYPFWHAINPSTVTNASATTTWNQTDPDLADTVQKLRMAGDGFLDVVRRHADAEGGLSEQFDRDTGFCRGAADLTWSYGALLEAAAWRERSAYG
ncbi:MAG: Glucoamylase, intracellular sporulation-specific [Sclerophora amabilis]|nr:MAG: Glucoamylase, intracellular sporulation-specific [Sclerophora amabilis]